MRAWNREIRVYKTADGREPFTKWMASLKNEKVRRAILMRIDRLSLGNPGDWKTIKTPEAEGLREMRLQLEGGYRLFFAEDGPVIIVLLCGGSKATQDSDIRRAVGYLNDYRSRK
ncbi:MAG: type II toxin-antitoxin system RelE/ParE family toxin [Nitrospinae bacterium]|nr:type II toxin-antitoxin system RelE/ParE family toxin [Nitrospinota bacterium]